MNDYIEMLLCICGIIATVGAAITYMHKAKVQLEEPHREIARRLDHHDVCLANDDRRLKKLESENDSLREDIRQMMLAFLGVMDNDEDEKEKAKKALYSYLANRK